MSETMISILIFVLGLIIGISAILVINYIRNKKKEMKDYMLEFLEVYRKYKLFSNTF